MTNEERTWKLVTYYRQEQRAKKVAEQPQSSKEEFIKCVKKYTRENTAESLVDFCIKEKM